LLRTGETLVVSVDRDKAMDTCKNDKKTADLVSMLLDVIEKQNARIIALENEVKELKRQLNSNSKNSSKPPSSDGFCKPKSLRQSNGKIGAPLGHKSGNLAFVDNPDHIINHQVGACRGCQKSLELVVPAAYDCRQVYDMPEIRLEVTEHRAESKKCPDCGKITKATFPGGVNAHTQYGDQVKAYITYMSVQNCLSLERIAETTHDLMGHDISQTTALNHLNDLYGKAEEVEKSIKEDLLNSLCIHADESGVRVEKKTYWIHSASDSKSTLYGVHKSRGGIAIDEIGLLPEYNGVVAHDCYSIYFKDTYSFGHALCGVHLLRECQGIIDHDKQKWPELMISVLHDIRGKGAEAKRVGEPVCPKVISNLETRYNDVIKSGREETLHLVPEKPKEKKKGKVAQPKCINLLDRLEKYKPYIFISLHNQNVPFDNNQAERDIRFVKVKQNVSGSFRTEKGAKVFARIRGIISTARKRELAILPTLISLSKNELSFNL
jgi:transposase